MFFSSDRIVFQWDTWMYFHDGVYYLYYLAKDKSKYGYWNCFGVATSTDGVEWKDYGIALAASDKMVNILGTGSVWKSVDFDKTGIFICNYSEGRNDESGKPTQIIYFAWSKDLIHWMYVF